MDLQGIANSVGNTVNPNFIVSVQRSTGSTQAAPGGRRAPTYAPTVSGPAQIQALNNSELRQMDGLNIQGVIQAIYLRGALAGVVRVNSQGGDIVPLAAPAPAQVLGTCLVVKVLAAWPLWTHAAIQLQAR